MPAVSRNGDPNNGRGRGLATDSSFVVEGRAILGDGDPVTPHPRRHVGVRTAGGSSSFIVNGYPINRSGDADTCGHTRTASTSTFIIP